MGGCGFQNLPFLIAWYFCTTKVSSDGKACDGYGRLYQYDLYEFCWNFS